jgi:serine phosphatase RsbU (regulator of sigma subunit)
MKVVLQHRIILILIIIIILIRGFIIKQKTAKILKNQQTEIIEKNRILTDSIVYAKKIQTAVLPDKEVLNNCFKNYFIFFKPKDIVSGDFYWISENNQNTVIAVADSTGHGVPGAFMSMLGISF